MIYWYDSSGKIVISHSEVCPGDYEAGPEHCRFLTRPEDLDISTHYVEHGLLKPMPEKPGPWHEFDYEAKAWAPNHERAWKNIRRMRDTRLAACDWVTARAMEVGEPVPDQWREYRQALRDITEQADPSCVVWPVAPE